MSFLQRVFAPVYQSQRLDWLRAGSTYSGRKVSAESALGLVPVFNAVSQIAGAVGCLPLEVFKRDASTGRSLAFSHPAWGLLHEEPNPEMAADEFWEMIESHIDLWGNAYAYQVKRADGTTEQLWPLAPDRVMVDRDDRGRRRFHIEGQVFGEDTILHFRGLSLEGLIGYSPIQLARNALANAEAQEEFQGRFLREDGKPAVLLRHPNELKPDAQKRLKKSWDSAKAGGTVVLEENIAVERWTMPLEDAQFIQQMEFSDKRIAQMFMLQPGRLGAKSGDSLKYSTTEGENKQFVTYTLQRRLRRIEGTVRRGTSIFPTRDHFAKFNLDELLRAEQKERYESYKTGIDAGFLDPDLDVRPKENLPPRAA